MSGRWTVPSALLGVALTLAIALIVVVAAVLAASAQALPAEPDLAARCAKIIDDDALRPLPSGLADTVRARFGLGDAPTGVVARGTVWRCEAGQVLVCFAGANLPCGKLDRRTELPAADAWCAQHADAPIPAVVTGHDSAWRWRCNGTRAVRDGQAWLRDRHGFARETWRPLTPAE